MRVARSLNQSEAKHKIQNSGLVTSSQEGVHPSLEKHLRRHLQNTWSQPFHRPSSDVYLQLKEMDALSGDRPFILDSGCGTGQSTRKLASLFPHHLVIGVDRSIARLSRSGMGSTIFQAGNCIFLRAELATFWRLLANDGFTPQRHFLFYPNPWPKPAHLHRRWHGHPVFPHLLLLGGEIELRCNWEIYAQEFALAVNIATGASVSPKCFEPERGLSPFEQKYLERGQPLFSVLVPAQLTAGYTLARLPV